MKIHPTMFFHKDKQGRYAVLTWEFWRTMLVVFCVFCWVGRWMEIPYIAIMDHFFGIVADDYAARWEPLFCPYWVYGIGVTCITLLLEPWKEKIQKRRKTTWGAFLETFVYITIIAAVLETIIGLLINQFDPALGKYPFWDNSQLPLNILGQGWLVNDLLLGIMGSIYLWVFYPLIDKGLNAVPPAVANTILVVILILLALSTYFSYFV